MGLPPGKNRQIIDDDEFVKITIKSQGTSDHLIYNLEKINLNKIINDSEETILHIAVRYKDIEAVQKLIDLGCDINVGDKYGSSPLLVATMADFKSISEELIRILCKANAAVLTSDYEGRSPLSLVLDTTRFTERSIVKIILEKLQSECGNYNELIAEKLIEAKCPLARAICLNNAEVTKLLIKNGTPVDAPHPTFRQTALHTAVSLMDLPNVKLLVDCGANVIAQDMSGLIPLLYYRSSFDGIEQPEIVRILTRKREHMMFNTVNGEMQVGQLLSRGTAQVIRVLLENNLDLRARDRQQNTPLHYLVSNTNPNIVEQLEGRDIDVHAQDRNGATPLFYAIRSISMMEFLLKKGANIDFVDRCGNTLLMKAVHTLFACDINNQRALEVLLENGASPQFIPRNGLTIFDDFRLSDPEAKPFLEMVMGHLLIGEELGVPILEHIHQKIAAKPNFKKRMDLDRILIGKLKNTKVTGSLSAYTVLVENVDQLVTRCLRSGGETLSRLQHIHQGCKKFLTVYLLQLLHKRLEIIINRITLVHEASEVMGRLMGLHYTSNYLIIREIISYLNYEEMRNLTKLGID